MTYSDILAIGEKDGLFYKFSEGDGSNLLAEVEAAGYVDYLMLDVGNLVDSSGYVNEDGYVDGAQIMLKEMYQDIFDKPEDVVQHCIDCDFIPMQPYKIVFKDGMQHYGFDKNSKHVEYRYAVNELYGELSMPEYGLIDALAYTDTVDGVEYHYYANYSRKLTEDEIICYKMAFVGEVEAGDCE